MFSTQRKGLVTVHMKFQGMFFSASFSLRCSFGCTHLDPGSTLNQVLTGFHFSLISIWNATAQILLLNMKPWKESTFSDWLGLTVWWSVRAFLRWSTPASGHKRFRGFLSRTHLKPFLGILTIFSEMGIDFELSRKIIYQYFKRTPKHLNFRYLSTELIVE